MCFSYVLLQFCWIFLLQLLVLYLFCSFTVFQTVFWEPVNTTVITTVTQYWFLRAIFSCLTRGHFCDPSLRWPRRATRILCVTFFTSVQISDCHFWRSKISSRSSLFSFRFQTVSFFSDKRLSATVIFFGRKFLCHFLGKLFQIVTLSVHQTLRFGSRA